MSSRLEQADRTRRSYHEYESQYRKSCRHVWLKQQDYNFSGQGSLGWKQKRENRASSRYEVVVPVRLPMAPPRKPLSISSGRLTAAYCLCLALSSVGDVITEKPINAKSLQFQLRVRLQLVSLIGLADSDICHAANCHREN